MTTAGALLTAHDEHMRGIQPEPPAGVRYEQDGPLPQVVGEYRGSISGPRDIAGADADMRRIASATRTTSPSWWRRPAVRSSPQPG